MAPASIAARPPRPAFTEGFCFQPRSYLHNTRSRFRPGISDNPYYRPAFYRPVGPERPISRKENTALIVSHFCHRLLKSCKIKQGLDRSVVAPLLLLLPRKGPQRGVPFQKSFTATTSLFTSTPMTNRGWYCIGTNLLSHSRLSVL